MPRGPDTQTRDKILDVAQRLVQSRGFSGFSYADIATKVGIQKASIHHHFPTKGALGTKLMARYRTSFGALLVRIELEESDARARLKRYAKVFADVLRDGHRMCMCGMLAADFDTLPKSVRTEVRGFIEDNEAWLARVFEEGRKKKQLTFKGDAEAHARVVLAAFEGAMLVARARGEVASFEAVASSTLTALGAGS